MGDSEDVNLVLFIFEASSYLSVEIFPVELSRTVAYHVVLDLFLVVRMDFRLHSLNISLCIQSRLFDLIDEYQLG